MSDKTVLVTGCTSGIGLCVARHLERAGMTPLLVGRNEEKLRGVSAELGGAPSVVCDLEDNRQIEGIFRFCTDAGIKLSGMVHCAGVGTDMPIRLIREETLERAMQVHYFAFVELCKYFQSKKISQDGASIVAISSISTMTRRVGSVAYSSSKSALNTAVQVAAKEFVKRGIRVNALLPAYVGTRMIEDTLELVNIREVQPWGLISPEAIADIVGFLLSDESKYVTGALIPVTAGMEVN